MPNSSFRDYYRDSYAHLAHGGPGEEAEPTFRLRVQAGLDALGAAPQRVLDFGCGSGAATALLASRGHTAVGVDISESGIRIARHRGAGAFLLADEERRLPFRTGSFDACFCTEVIEHLFHVEGFLAEINRVLRQGGRLLLTTPYHGWMKNMAIAAYGFDHHFDPTSGHIRFFTRRTLTRLLADASFETERVQGIGRTWPMWKSIFVAARKT